jgi:hypothetical protein
VKDGAAVVEAEPFFIAPGNNRAMQARRTGERRLFGDDEKEGFLEHFSTTANCAASAAAVGFSEGVVYAHRLKDPKFRSNYWAALEMAAGKLAALRIQHEIEREEGSLSEALAAKLDGPPDLRQIGDLVKLMASLRDLSRNLEGVPKAGRPAEAASLEETCAALAKRLKAFPPAGGPQAG